MSVLTPFDPVAEGWSFENWREATPFSWDLMRRTYLAINPTDDIVEAPLDCAFYEIFKSCASNGNCGGFAMLGIALHKFGGFMGFCSPASFYTGPWGSGATGPDRMDLHQAINIMQARQFSAPGIRNFLDVVKAGQLNDGYAAFARIASGLASDDYPMISISNGLFGDAAHTLIPYRVEEPSPGTKEIYLWDSDRPFSGYPGYYTGGFNRIVITGPTSWHYDQNVLGLTDGTTYDGFNNGWCFAVPTSLELHKGRQPISVGFALTGLTLLFASGIGAAVTQIEDDDGRRLYATDRAHRTLGEFESDPSVALDGVARWPWYGASRGGPLPGDLYLIERPAGSPPLNVTVHGSQYKLLHAQAGNLVEIQAAATRPARDRIRVADFAGADQAVELRTDSERRTVHVRQLRAENGGRDWRSIDIRNTHVSKGHLRIETSGGLNGVQVSGATTRMAFDLEIQRYRGARHDRRSLGRPTVNAGESLTIRPRDWDAIADTKVDRQRRSLQRPKRAPSRPSRP